MNGEALFSMDFLYMIFSPFPVSLQERCYATRTLAILCTVWSGMRCLIFLFGFKLVIPPVKCLFIYIIEVMKIVQESNLGFHIQVSIFAFSLCHFT